MSILARCEWCGGVISERDGCIHAHRSGLGFSTALFHESCWDALLPYAREHRDGGDVDALREQLSALNKEFDRLVVEWAIAAKQLPKRGRPRKGERK